MLLATTPSLLIPVCNRIFILRQNTTAGEISKPDFDEHLLTHMMSGYVEHRLATSLGTYVLNEEILSFSHVNCHHAGIKDLSFTIRKGETVGLVSNNTSLPNLLLHMFRGNLPVNSGEIRLNGKIIHLHSTRKTIAAGIGLVSENNNVFENLSLSENICIMAEKESSYPFGMININTLHFTQNDLIENFLGQDFFQENIFSIKQLSRLKRKDIAISKNLAMHPNVMVFLNPTVNLDHHSADVVYQRIRQCAQMNCANLVVSSKISDLLHTCDTIHFVFIGVISISICTKDNDYADMINMYSDFINRLESPACFPT